jgi:hypothetical protein
MELDQVELADCTSRTQRSSTRSEGATTGTRLLRLKSGKARRKCLPRNIIDRMDGIQTQPVHAMVAELHPSAVAKEPPDWIALLSIEIDSVPPTGSGSGL